MLSSSAYYATDISLLGLFMLAHYALSLLFILLSSCALPLAVCIEKGIYFGADLGHCWRPMIANKTCVQYRF